MNAVTKSFTDALRHPSARLSQRLRVWVGILEHDFDVVKFRVRGGFCKDYTADVTVTSSQLDLDGKQYVGRRAGLQIDERVAVPSVSHVNPVDHEAATFKDVTQELIRQALVDRKNFDAFDVEFQIEGLLEKMEAVVMYEESLWNFITRHCRRKGVFWFYRQGRGKSGQLDTIVFANHPRAYVRSVDVPLIPDSGLSAGCHEALLSLNDARALVPATIELYERNYRTPDDPLRATANVSSEADDRSVFGQVSRSAKFHLTQQQGEALTQMRRDEQIARQVTLSGTTNALGIAPGVVTTSKSSWRTAISRPGSTRYRSG